MKSPEVPSADVSDDDFDIADHTNTPYFLHLRKLPNELAARQMRIIDRAGYSPEKAAEYLQGILQDRYKASVKTEANEPRLAALFRDSPEPLHALETTVFTDTDNFLGKGMTARVKKMIVTYPEGDTETFAVKYVITPTEKTLSASGEHEVLREVEILTTLERNEIENHVDTETIRVPHPHFHHKTDRLQCYGMQCIDGITLKQALDSTMDAEFEMSLRESHFSVMPLEKIFSEVDKFWAAVHEHCIHGDIKSANIMIDRSGTLYIIDFGQAVLNNTITEKAREQYLNLRDDEVRLTKQAIVQLRNKLTRSQ